MGITEIIVVFFVGVLVNICFYKLYSLYIESEIYELRKEIGDTENDTKFLSEKIQKISEDFWIRRNKTSNDLKKLKRANRKLKKKFNKLYKLILDKDQVVMEPVVDSSSELHIDEIEELIDIGEKGLEEESKVDDVNNTGLVLSCKDRLIDYSFIENAKNGDIVKFTSGEKGIVSSVFDKVIVILGKGDTIQKGDLITLTDEKLIPLNPEETIHEPIKIQESASEKLEEVVTVKGRKVIDGGNIISRWKKD